MSPDSPIASALDHGPTDLEAVLDEMVRRAIRDEFEDAPEEVDGVVRPSKFADYQVNGALALAKKIGRNPREVAEALARHLLVKADVIASADVAGPGFINVTFTNEFLASIATTQALDARLGRVEVAEPKNIVVDYGGPNVAKEMHVGHLRSTIIGDTLTRILGAQGHNVVRQNHLGDWGTQFGMLIEHLLDDPEIANGASEMKVDELESVYRASRARFDGDEEFKARARRRVVDFQSGDQRSVEIWQMLVDESKRHFEEVFAGLDTLLTDEDYRGESMYNDMFVSTEKALADKGLLVESNGAMCVFPSDAYKGKDGEPVPLIIRKGDGGYGYAVSDLAAILYAKDHDQADLMLYVVDFRQAQHFAMVFDTAKLAGWINDLDEAVHIQYGTINGKDGKPFKTRTGGTIRLIELLTEAREKAAAVLDERGSTFEGDERENIVNSVALAALKWADLKNDHVSNYVFDMDAMTSFEGNTGPYVQYATTRAKSVLRKAEGNGSTDFVIEDAAERDLVLHLAAFDNVLQRTAAEYEPHQLCTYLYELAGRFSTFYEACPVITASSEELKQSRLGLCSLTARVLEEGLSQLGIRTLDRM